MTTIDSGVARWTADEARAHLDEILAVYVEAMGYPERVAVERRMHVARHIAEPAFRCVRVQAADGSLAGFGYGYPGSPGQWWHDEVARALPDDAVVRWLTGAFEVCELHVRPAWQGRGLGRALLAALVDEAPARTAVLSTPDSDTRARRLYRSAGFVDLLSQFRFRGDSRDFAVLGADLPLTWSQRGGGA